MPILNTACPFPGRWARSITRIDYREEAEEPLTQQSAGGWLQAPWQ